MSMLDGTSEDNPLLPCANCRELIYEQDKKCWSCGYEKGVRITSVMRSYNITDLPEPYEAKR